MVAACEMEGGRRMISLKAEDLKDFTRRLFIGGTFDGWLVREAVIVTFNTFTVDGRIRSGYYSEEEKEAGQMEELSFWKALRPFCFSLIRGKRLPESFRITLQAASEQLRGFLSDAGLGVDAEQVGGLYLHIRYENGELRCVSGLSLRIFTLDKQIEQEWDKAVKGYFRKNRIPFTEES